MVPRETLGVPAASLGGLQEDPEVVDPGGAGEGWGAPGCSSGISGGLQGDPGRYWGF